MVLFAYNLLFAITMLCFFFTLPLWAVVYGRRLGLRQRLGLPGTWRRPEGKLIYFHAASLGEVNALGPLIGEVKRRLPKAATLLTTLTTNARDLAVEKVGVDEARLLPFDFYPIVLAWLKRTRPDLIVVAETELWPAFFCVAAHLDIPLFVVNARISDGSYPWYRAFRVLVKTVLSGVNAVLARDALDAERYRDIGALAAKVKVCGDLKAEIASGADYGAGKKLMREIGLAGKVLLGGSLHGREGEEMLSAYLRLKHEIKGLGLLLAPRHLKHLEAMERSAKRLGLTTRRRSQEGGKGEVVLLDTHGELASLYGGAWAAFVGGSLVKKGGQNLLEPAAAGVPVLFGPHVENFRDFARSLQECGGGYCVRSADDIAVFLAGLAKDDAVYRHVVGGALEAVKKSKGAVGCIMKELGPYL